MSAEHPLILPEGYRPKLGILDTEIAIKLIKDTFENALASALNLTRVSAPLFVLPETGLNDNLNGVERPVRFDIKDLNREVEVVHSLAKWKRLALKRYGFAPNTGLYTDMNAIRRDEELDNLHSVYVDQWDWEKVITPEQRTLDYLYQTVNRILGALQVTEKTLLERFPQIPRVVPEKLAFLTSQQLEDRYPALTPKERENRITREQGAVFIAQIGGKLRSGIPHDGRAPDYDDWSLNGDILLYNPMLNRAFELSSMGIRVDKASLEKQLKLAGCEDRSTMPFHKMLLEEKLPLTIGGGIGQSRICMLLLQTAHIGEVQASVWPEAMMEACEQDEIHLL